MQKNIIKKEVPEKIDRAEVYRLIKDTEVICVDNMKLRIQDEDGTWPVVSNSTAGIYIRNLFVDKEWQPYLNASVMNGFIQTLKTDPDLQKDEKDFRHSGYLMTDAGIWNVEQGGIDDEHVSREMLFARKIPVKPSRRTPPESPAFQKFCEKVFGKDNLLQKRAALYEIIGYCISDITGVKKAIFLLGPANCGKSVILRFIQRLVGEGEVSNVSLANFAQKFSPVEMYGKTLNISGEVPSSALPGRALDVFKCVTGGDRIDLERKGSQPFCGIITTKLLFAGNTLPTFVKVDGSDALTERMHILRFEYGVVEEERDNGLEDRLWEERDIIVQHALQALAHFVRRNKTFIPLQDEQELLVTLKQVSNPIDYFMESCLEFDTEYMVHISDVYGAYQKFAVEQALPDIDRTTFRTLLTASQRGIRIGTTKRRLGKKSPKVCFEGVRLKEDNEKMYDKRQDTVLSDGKSGEER